MNITVVEVTPEELAIHAGADFKSLLQLLPDRIKEIEYNNQTLRQFREDSIPTREGQPYLPLNRAWLRDIDGRAFLYWQNW